VSITCIETLTDIVNGVKVVIDGTYVTLTNVTTVTVRLGTVTAVTVVVGVGRDKHPQAVDMSEHAKGIGAPAQVPTPGVDVVVVVVTVGILIDGTDTDGTDTDGSSALLRFTFWSRNALTTKSTSWHMFGTATARAPSQRKRRSGIRSQYTF